MNVGEELVSAYLQHVCHCEFVQTNLYTIDTQGEIDVIGINLKDRKVYVCEVAVHLTTGLQYTKNKRPNNIQKLTEKFSRDIEYAKEYFKGYERHFMLWSPVVKHRKGKQEYDQTNHLKEIEKGIKSKLSVDIEFIVNEKFLACLNSLRKIAREETADLKSPVMRLLQIEEHLNQHLKKHPPEIAL